MLFDQILARRCCCRGGAVSLGSISTRCRCESCVLRDVNSTMRFMLSLPFICPVSGISNYQAPASGVRRGDVLLVEHEADNPYDANAVRIQTLSGDTVGYVPAKLAAQLVDNGLCEGLTSRVDEVLDSYETIGLRVKLFNAASPDADRTGECDQLDTERPKASSVSAVEPEVSGEGGSIVRVRSTGRTLGRHVRTDVTQRKVFVAANGSEIGYPDAIVEVVDVDEVAHVV